MKKSFIGLLSLAIMILFSACSSKVLGEPRSSYEPTYVDKLSEENLAYIKVANNLGIWKVDNNRQANIFKVMFSGGLDSIKVKEGKHSLGLSYKGKDVNLGKVYYKKGHEYFIDYVADSRRISYWVKDVNTNEVVYGKEIKDEENN